MVQTLCYKTINIVCSLQTAWPSVDIHDVPPEMPIYLLQEDEGNDEEIMRLLLATEKESMGHFESDDVIPRLQREAHKRNVSLRISTTTRPATERNETQHLMKDNKLPSSQDLPVCDQPPSSFTGKPFFINPRHAKHMTRVTVIGVFLNMR